MAQPQPQYYGQQPPQQQPQYAQPAGMQPVAATIIVQQGLTAKDIMNQPVMDYCNCCGCLCDCCFCPACRVGENAEAFGIGSSCGWCCLYMMFPVCIGCHVRGLIQLKTGATHPGCFTNWCLHIWCRYCAIKQESAAAMAWKAQTGGGAAAIVIQQPMTR